MSRNPRKTTEELEADIQQTIKEVEQPTKETNEKTKSEESTTEESVSEVSETNTKEVQETEKTTETEDYKKKFIESSREAQILHAKNKKVNEALQRAIDMQDPDEKELVAQYPDWDVMSDFEKKIAKSDLKNSRRFEALEEIAIENKDIEVWRGKVDTFLDNPENLNAYPQLDGREDEFKLFASKPTRRGVDFEDLVAAFSYSNESKKPTPKKGGMFETGSGGPATKSKPKKLSIMEARSLRESDYGEYVRMLRAGKIDDSDL